MNKRITNKISDIKILYVLIQFLFDLFFGTIRKILKIFSSKGESICIVSIHKLGDSVFTFDTVNSIKSFYKKNVYIICHYNAKDIYELIHPKELVISLPKESFHLNDRYLDSKARKVLKSLNPEIIIDITGVMTSATLIFNSKAKKIFGMNRKIFRSIFDKFIEVNTNLKSIEIYLNAIKNIIPINSIKIPIENKYNKVKKILIAPFAGWKSKEWGLGKFIRLAERLNSEFDVEFVFDNTFISQEILNYLKLNNIQFSFSETIKELIEKINSTDLLIGNDSGPVQIAAFLGKRTFSIYGPTNPDYHIPKGERNKFIQKKIFCSPGQNERLCFTDGGKSGCPSFECMHLLSVEEVYSYLKSEVL